MTASTAVADQESGIAHPALDAPERAALLDTLRSEIAKARPHPVAERTLLLILQAAVAPSVEAPGYRVLDRHGAPRMHPAAEGEAAKPFSLADLIAEQRIRHPGLFLPPEPEPAPAASATPVSQDSTLAVQAAEMRAATARFLGSQSERARTLAEQSSAQGRALAQSAAGAFANLRGRLRREDAPATAAATTQEEADRTSFREAAAERLGDLRDRMNGFGEPDGRRGRVWLGAAGAVTAVMLVLAVVVNRNGPETAQAPSAPSAPANPAPGAQAQRTTPPVSPAPEAAPPSRAQSVPDNVTPPPEGDGRGDGEPDAPPPANALTGPVQVIDTATLKVNGKVVRLFGVEWVRGGQADELARYIAGRSVSCLPAPGSQTMNCSVDGRDLSEVVLYNGGGRASPEASPELVAAEDHARSERLGVWKR
jgi:endonuclease YncB( thermonuclease family)